MRFRFLQALVLALLPACAALAQPVSIFTQRYANDRLGWNRRETVLTPANVRTAGFGLLYSYPVDDQVYAQPLLVAGVPVAGAARNLLVVASVNNTLYAFDADHAPGSGAATALWQRSLTRTGYRPVRNTDMSGACGGFYRDFSGKMGIVGTPVADSATQTLYIVHREVNSTGNIYSQWLHAIDLGTGAERAGSPVAISASLPGTGDGSVNGRVRFDAQKNNQRPGLLLHRGMVYIGWSSHCDWGPYHGWLIGYDAASLQQRVVYTTTPEGGDGGIWMSGCGPMTDADGDIYLTTGNGTVGTDRNRNDPRNRGESLLRLRNVRDTLRVIRFFTPANFQFLEDNDLDYGSDGAIFIPGTRYNLSGSKDGVVYMTHADSMAGYSPGNASVKQAYRPNVQTDVTRHVHGSPVYASYVDSLGRAQEYAFMWAESDSLKRIRFDRATMKFDLAHEAKGSVKLDEGMPGSMLAVSSNGLQWGSTIIWANHPLSGNANQEVRPGRLQAYDARDITRPIYSTDALPGRDLPGSFSKFNTPVVANGRVYMATFSSRVNVYGVLATTGVKSQTGQGMLFAFSPNPARDAIQVTVAKQTAGRDARLELFDALGRRVLAQPLAGSALVSLPAGLKAGLYVVHFYLDGRRVQTEQLIRE